MYHLCIIVLLFELRFCVVALAPFGLTSWFGFAKTGRRLWLCMLLLPTPSLAMEQSRCCVSTAHLAETHRNENRSSCGLLFQVALCLGLSSLLLPVVVVRPAGSTNKPAAQSCTHPTCTQKNKQQQARGSTCELRPVIQCLSFPCASSSNRDAA